MVDDVRIQEKGKNELGNNQWNVDLVYHSGKCIQLTVAEDKDGFSVVDPLWQYNYPEEITEPSEDEIEEFGI